LAEALEPFKEDFLRLQSAPGVGPVVAATYLAVIATPERFPTSSHVASYLGLVPSTYDSGERERHGRITKQGSTELRAVLCEAAHRAADPHHPLNPYFVKVVAKGGYRRAIVAVAHRLARILFQMWKKKEDFDVTKLGVDAGEYIVKRKRYFVLKGARPGRRCAA
jgi:transposase